MCRLAFVFVCLLSIASKQVIGFDTNRRIDYDYFSLNIVDDKAYLTADQLILKDKEILVLVQDKIGVMFTVPVAQINCDHQGLFVFADCLPRCELVGPCPIGHAEECAHCHKCRELRCPYRCQCLR